jgi:hypothetical protein
MNEHDDLGAIVSEERLVFHLAVASVLAIAVILSGWLAFAILLYPALTRAFSGGDPWGGNNPLGIVLGFLASLYGFILSVAALSYKRRARIYWAGISPSWIPPGKRSKRYWPFSEINDLELTVREDGFWVVRFALELKGPLRWILPIRPNKEILSRPMMTKAGFALAHLRSRGIRERRA